MAKEIRSCAADRLLSLPQPQEKERMALWIKALLLALIVLVSEMLIREDYFHCRVPKWGLRSLLILAALLRSVALLENGSDPLSFMYSLTASLVRASLFILPLLLLYALKRSPGPADIKYVFFVSFLLESRTAYALIIGSCIWGVLAERQRIVLASRDRLRFAFLPYLILTTLPFIFLEYWA